MNKCNKNAECTVLCKQRPEEIEVSLQIAPLILVEIDASGTTLQNRRGIRAQLLLLMLLMQLLLLLQHSRI